MSKLQQLLNQWSNLSDAADELQAAAAAVERAHADHPELSQSLRNIEIATSEMLALIDTRISETLPANPREAAILAAFASALAGGKPAHAPSTMPCRWPWRT